MNFQNMHNIKLIIILVLTFGCTQMNHDFSRITKPPTMTMEPPDGPPIYQQGFREGCESGYSGYSNSFNKMFWRWKQDPELAQNEVYYKIWKDAYGYCAVYAMMLTVHGFSNGR